MLGSPKNAVGKLSCRLCGTSIFRTFDINAINVIQCRECGGFKMKIVSMCVDNEEKAENSDEAND